MSDCVETHLSRNQFGYGWKAYKRGDGKWGRTLHHRVVYAQHHGLAVEELRGKVVMHSCDNPPCINPDHLIMGTVAENVADRDAKNRVAHGVKHVRAKLTAEKVREIRSRSGETQASLALEFGVHNGTISNVLSGKTWRRGDV